MLCQPAPAVDPTSPYEYQAVPFWDVLCVLNCVWDVRGRTQNGTALEGSAHPRPTYEALDSRMSEFLEFLCSLAPARCRVDF